METAGTQNTSIPEHPPKPRKGWLQSLREIFSAQSAAAEHIAFIAFTHNIFDHHPWWIAWAKRLAKTVGVIMAVSIILRLFLPFFHGTVSAAELPLGEDVASLSDATETPRSSGNVSRYFEPILPSAEFPDTEALSSKLSLFSDVLSAEMARFFIDSADISAKLGQLPEDLREVYDCPTPEIFAHAVNALFRLGGEIYALSNTMFQTLVALDAALAVSDELAQEPLTRLYNLSAQFEVKLKEYESQADLLNDYARKIAAAHQASLHSPVSGASDDRTP